MVPGDLSLNLKTLLTHIRYQSSEKLLVSDTVPCVPLFLFGSRLSGLNILYFDFNLCLTILFVVYLSSVVIHRVFLR